MKTSLRSLAAAKTAERPKPSPAAKRPPAAPVEPPSYRTAQTRENTRQLAGHFPADVVLAWRVLAAEQDMDSQELLAVGMNMVFERYGKPQRVEITSGRRKKK
jgi:hypothetical protein